MVDFRTDRCGPLRCIDFDYIKTGLVLKFPTLIVCGFAVIAALMSLFAGVMLETMTLKNRQDFEYQLLRIQNEKNKNEQRSKSTLPQ